MLKLFKRKSDSARTKKNKDTKENENAASGKTIYFSYKKRLPTKRIRTNHKVKINNINLQKYSYFIYIGFSIVLSFVLIFFIGTISINSVNCITMKSQRCDDVVTETLSKHKNSKLYSSYNLIHTELKNELSVENFKISFDLINFRWNVEISPKRPVYAITNESTQNYLMVADNGYVISSLDSNDLALPLLIVKSDLPGKGVLLDKSILFALSLINDFNFMYNVDHGNLTPDGLVIELDSKKRVLFPLEGDREVLVGGVMYILGRLENQSSITRQEKILLESDFEIDMRFENPVLRPYLR